MSLLPVAEAQARLLAMASPLAIERVPLASAAGRAAAEDVIARRNQPAVDLSSMDGYAVRWDDLPGPLTVIGESRAGTAFAGAVRAGEAVRIFTGAAMPPGADTVLIQEETTRDGAQVRMTGAGPRARGSHVRQRGSDFSQGSMLIPAAAPLTAPRIGLAALGGHGDISVRALPRVTLLSTGDELVAPGADDAPDRLPASNAVMLRALIGTHAIVRDGGIVPDQLSVLTAAFTHAAQCGDVIVSTGGASVGDHDLVQPALLAAGATLDFWKVAMRPGKPLMVARLGPSIVLGLPGNPVSAFVTAQLFLLPLLRRLNGAEPSLPETETRPLIGALPAAGPREEYLRATLHPDGVRPLSDQDSAGLSALARANALIKRPAGASIAREGTKVDLIRLA